MLPAKCLKAIYDAQPPIRVRQEEACSAPRIGRHEPSARMTTGRFRHSAYELLTICRSNAATSRHGIETTPPGVVKPDALFSHENAPERRSHPAATDHDSQDAERLEPIQEQKEPARSEHDPNHCKAHGSWPVVENHRNSSIFRD